MNGYVEEHVRSDAVLTKIFREDQEGGDKYFYRGQSNTGWRLCASFDRVANGNLVQRQKEFDDHFADFKQRYILRRSDNLSDDQLGALAQHYGLYTRFLDWTDKPYIAQFFACNPKEEKPCAVYRLNWTKMREHVSKTDFDFINADTSENARLGKQHGYLLKNMSNFENLEDYLESRTDIVDVILTKHLISRTTRQKIFSNLMLMGIGYSALFDGLEYLAREVNSSRF